MKKGLFALAGLFLLLSCNDDHEETNDADHAFMTTAKSNTENNKVVYRAIETGDVSKLDSFMAKDIIDHEGNMGKDIVGLDSIKSYLGNIHKYFDGLKLESISEGTSLDGQYHFALVRMTGKAKENPWNIPVGTDMDDMSVDVVKIKDGKASEHWSFTSMKDMMEMMEGMKMGNKPAAKRDTTQKR